ncbi:conserved hypothetical protein [Gammaproteobacteria bacterium]
MLREILHTCQIAGEPRRRWFRSNDFDLIVWYGDQGQPSGFQLCYGHHQRAYALTWHTPAFYSHMAVDDGEGRPFRYKGTPILIPDGVFDADRLREAFLQESTALPSEILSLVLAKLREHPK